MKRIHVFICTILLLAIPVVVLANWSALMKMGIRGCGCQPTANVVSEQFEYLGSTSGYCQQDWIPSGTFYSKAALVKSGSTEYLHGNIESCYYLTTTALADGAYIRPNDQTTASMYMDAWVMIGTTTALNNASGMTIFSFNTNAAAISANLSVQALPTTGQSVFATWYWTGAGKDGLSKAITPGTWYHIRMAYVELGANDMFEWFVSTKDTITEADLVHRDVAASMARQCNRFQMGRIATLGAASSGMLSFDNVFVDSAKYVSR